MQFLDRRVLIITGLFLAGFAPATRAELPPYRHDHLNIYPVSAITTNLRIDGDLSDWQPAAFVAMCADPDLKDRFSVKIAFAYDASALYVAAHFVDQSPLINHVDPKVDPFGGWNGDALQIRFITDAAVDHPIPVTKFNSDAIVHLTAWLYSDQNLPTLDIRRGMDFHKPVTLTGVAAGFSYKPETNGYSLEGRIPWTLLDGGAPQPGQTRIMTVQPLWGDAGGRYQTSFFDCIRAAGFQFQRPDGWGHGYFVKPDEVAAKLVAQADEEKKLFPVARSSTTGIPLTYTNPAKGFVSLAVCKPAGQIVRTLLTKAPRDAGTQTEMWDGLDDYGKPVPPDEYTLKALTHAGIKPRFVTSVMNSGNPSWGNKGGHYGWGADHGVPNWAASDPAGNTYLLWTFNEGGNYLIKVDAAGRKQWGADGRGAAVAYDDGFVYVAYNDYWTNTTNGLYHAVLRIYEASTGKYLRSVNVSDWPKSLYDESIEKIPPWIRMHAGDYTPMDCDYDIVGIAASPDRLFCALYLENKIVALDKKTFAVRETYPVTRPTGLAYDNARKLLYAVSGSSVIALDAGNAKTIVSTGLEVPIGLALDKAGNLWVSVRGHQMQVLGFDPTGKPLGAIGKTGGRPWIGKFIPGGILMPGGISIDAQNRLWVPEEDNMPKRISLWDMKTHKLIRNFYGSTAYAPMMAPDPEKPEEVYLHNCRFIVDYDKGTWRPDATVFRANYDGPTIPGSEQHPGFMGNSFQVARFKGKKFAFNGRGGVFAVQGDRFKPLLYMGNAFDGTVTNLTPADRHGTIIAWADKNGDGLISEDEVQQVTKRPYDLPFAGNIYGFGGAFWPGATFISGYKIFQPTGLTKKGVPIYPDPRSAPTILTGNGPAKPYFVGPTASFDDIWPSLRSNWSEFYGTTTDPAGDSVMRVTRDGTIRWRYAHTVGGFALNAPLAKIGDLYGAKRILGEVELPAKNGGEIVGIGCYRGYFGFLNEDGLFIDQVGYDNGRGPSPNFDVFFIENFSGYFFKHPRTGKVYLFCGDVDARILELQGWSTIRRFDAGKVTVTETQFRAALGAGESKTEGAHTLVVAAGNDWKDAKPGKIALDESKQAEVALMSDDQNLYAHFDVPDSSPWQNSSTDWRFVFKGGDSVDIQLGQLYRGEGKRKPQPGDVRIFLAPTGQAVAMWKLVPTGMDKAPQLYTSPTGEETFERVALLTNVTCKVERRAAGYTLVATIPWKELGLTPPAKFSQLQGDVGVLLSDAGGTHTILRRYLFSQDTGIVNDIPNEVRVLDSNWGTLVFQ